MYHTAVFSSTKSLQQRKRDGNIKGHAHRGRPSYMPGREYFSCCAATRNTAQTAQRQQGTQKLIHAA